MIYTILDVSDLNSVDWLDIPHHSQSTVRRSLNGLQFIIKYDVTPDFITDEVEYTHSEILTIVNGTDWSENIVL